VTHATIGHWFRRVARSWLVTLASFPATASALLLRVLAPPYSPAIVRWLRVNWIGDSDSASSDHPPATWWLKALLIAAATTALSAYLTLGIVLNVAYPLRGDVRVTDWGGPTLLGRWAVHAGGGLLFAAVAAWLLPATHALARRWLAAR
jgi:hypothetical protein